MNNNKIVTINVTENDIKYGIKQNNNCCPIARAIKRKFKTQHVAVCYQDIGILKNDSLQADNFFHLDKEILNFMKKFDKGEQVKPFKFELHF